MQSVCRRPGGLCHYVPARNVGFLQRLAVSLRQPPYSVPTNGSTCSTVEYSGNFHRQRCGCRCNNNNGSANWTGLTHLRTFRPFLIFFIFLDPVVSCEYCHPKGGFSRSVCLQLLGVRELS